MSVESGVFFVANTVSCSGRVQRVAPWPKTTSSGLDKLSLLMSIMDIRQAKTQFSRLVDLADSGEEIIITKCGKPVARLVPYATKGAVRRPGTMRGKIRIKKSFDVPLPNELLDSFE